MHGVPLSLAFSRVDSGSDGVIDQLLTVFPQAASEKDDVGKLLLHYAAEKQATDSGGCARPRALRAGWRKVALAKTFVHCGAWNAWHVAVNASIAAMR